MSAGRKRGKEWSEVIVEGENISCSHCHEVLSKKIERVRNHLSFSLISITFFYYRVADEPVSPQQENSAEAWLTQYDPSLMDSLMRFQIKDEESFPPHLFQEPTRSMSPKKWWAYVKIKSAKREDPSLERFCILMIKLHSCPASSASIERWFSSFGFIWSKTRNRLGAEKAMKLVKIYRTLRKND